MSFVSVTRPLSARMAAIAASIGTQVLPSPSKQNLKVDFPKPLGRELQNQRNGVPICYYKKSKITLASTAICNRLGTGVGVSLTDSTFSVATTTSFGVFFSQIRSPNEREYTALIVALQWLGKIEKLNPKISWRKGGIKNTKTPLTLLVQNETVFNQLVSGCTTGMNSSLPIKHPALHHLAMELIQKTSSFNFTVRLCLEAPSFQACIALARRALLLEQSDKGFDTFVG